LLCFSGGIRRLGRRRNGGLKGMIQSYIIPL
jgi:hypothetical protein